MQRATKSLTRGGRTLLSLIVATFAMFVLGTVAPALAQLAGGTYTIGGTSPTYATIDAAINATASGISGPVTFLIRSGTYTSYGWYLYSRTGMSATNTITFKPDVGASVTLSGSVSYAGIFNVNNGDYYIIDGSNVAGGTTKDMTILNTNSSYGSAIVFSNNADYNTVKNCILQSTAQYVSTAYGATVNFYGSSSTSGTDYNTVQNCQIGDYNGTYRPTCAVYSYGYTTTIPNVGNRVTGCDVVNWGHASIGTTPYAIYVNYYNDGFQIDGNEIHMTSAPYYYYVYGLYIYEYYGYTKNTKVERNKIYSLLPGLGMYGYGYVYHLYYYGYYAGQYQATNFQFNNNMLTYHSDANIYAYPMYLYAYYANANSTINVNFNSIRITGTSTYSTYPFYLYSYAGGTSSTITVNHRNNIYEVTKPYAYYLFLLYYVNWANFNSDNNILYHNSQGSSYFAYGYDYIGYTFYHANLAAYQSATNKDQNSFAAQVPFRDPSTGDLHIASTCEPFVGESRGVVVSGITNDFDAQTRSTFKPDIGADEGDFNGDGIRVTAPTAGYVTTSASPMTVSYTTNRPMAVQIDLSTDGGSSWSTMGIVNPTIAGTNNYTFTTPYIATTQGQIRVRSRANVCEEHFSPNFAIVHPSVSLSRPNGGEFLVPTDTTRIEWSSLNIPVGMTVDLWFSPNNGSTWTKVMGNLPSQNSPAVNSYDWVVPNMPTTTALVRVNVTGRNEADTSNAVFTIVPQPSVQLTSPNGGELLLVGTEHNITWTHVTTEYVGLDYSTDAGATWKSIAGRVPAFVGELKWLVPNTPSESTLVRITDRTRPRFNDRSDALFTIGLADITVLAPNGGEKYNLGQPVTVSWQAQNTSRVKIDYSSDNGTSWTTIAPSVGAGLGTYTFTPVAVPTKLALVRVSNADRAEVNDVSNAPFEIQADKSITVLAPSTGEKLVRGSTAIIQWEAPRVDMVSITYSSNGGQNWQTVTPSISAQQGSFVWTVPNQNTTEGKIRIQEIGGSIMGETGLFSIVDPSQPLLRVIAPNGGENYTEGDPIRITWSAADVQRVTLAYSTNSGTSWNTIASGVTASAGQYDWVAPSTPSTHYRVRATSGSPSISDMSDADFTVNKATQPRIVVLAPNGGESYVTDTTVTIRWSATDVTGDVNIRFSADNGMNWSDLATVPASAGMYDWTVPSATTNEALISVETTDGSLNDRSDALFSIVKRTLAPIMVLTPNGGEVWKYAEEQAIRWMAPEQVTMVKIELSTDGGSNWTMLKADAPSTGGAPNSWLWTVPNFSDNSASALIRVTNVADASHFDVSDAVFSIWTQTGGIEFEAVAGGALRMLGAYPNPFATVSQLRWNQSRTGEANLRLFTQSGQLVLDQALGMRTSGEQQVDLKANDLSSGVYVVEIRVGSDVVRGTVMVVR